MELEDLKKKIEELEQRIEELEESLNFKIDDVEFDSLKHQVFLLEQNLRKISQEIDSLNYSIIDLKDQIRRHW